MGLGMHRNNPKTFGTLTHPTLYPSSYLNQYLQQEFELKKYTGSILSVILVQDQH